MTSGSDGFDERIPFYYFTNRSVYVRPSYFLEVPTNLDLGPSYQIILKIRVFFLNLPSWSTRVKTNFRLVSFSLTVTLLFLTIFVPPS